MSLIGKTRHFFELWPTYKRFFGYVWPDRGFVGLGYVTIVIAVVTNTAMIWLIGKPFNLLQQQEYDAVPGALLMFAAVVVVNQAAQLAGGILAYWIGFRTIGRMRNAILEKCLYLSFPVVSRFARGDLLARLSNDIDKVKLCVVDGLLFVVSHCLTMVIYVAMLFWINLELALWAMVITPVFLLHQRFFAPRKRRAAEKFYAKNGQLLSFEEQALANLRGISSYTAESFVAKLHRSVFEKARFWVMKERGLDTSFAITFSFLIYLTGLVIVLVGVSELKEGRFGVGHLVSFLLYLGYLTVPARGLADILMQLMGSLGAAKRMLEVFDAKPAVIEKYSAKPLNIQQGVVAIRDVTFGYPAGIPIYKNISATIKAGETVALVGPSGVGKSTLAMLLVRFYDPQAGAITIDGVDIRDVNLNSLRHAVTIVSQEPFLISDTIRANLTMVNPDADEAQMIKACKDSFAWEFIEQMKAGLDANIGLGGASLSTGQRQRLAIAQAFLREAPILVMDEATSALDSHGEQMVVDAVKRLRKGRTTLIIAHRYSSIKSADRIIYFNGDGTITIGEHDDLMKTHEHYREAVIWQTSHSEEGKR
jgi:ATP-binding cassette subfamily B protein